MGGESGKAPTGPQVEFDRSGEPEEQQERLGFYKDLAAGFLGVFRETCDNYEKSGLLYDAAGFLQKILSPSEDAEGVLNSAQQFGQSVLKTEIGSEFGTWASGILEKLPVVGGMLAAALRSATKSEENVAAE